MVDSKKQRVVAIDGYSSTGKSTIAKGLASRLGLVYIDSGAMYRAVTYYALENGLISDDGKINTEKLYDALDTIEIDFHFNSETGKSETLLNAENVENQIRTPRVASVVSEVSALSRVRSFLVFQQQKMGEKGGIVMDGRDIGTVVFPHAMVKIFTTAAEDIRVKRRFDELRSKGDSSDMESVRENLLHRDYIDENRSDSPLRRAEDAIVLDNSQMSMDEQLEWAVRLVQDRMA